jgi:hypothetical protein
MNTALENEKRLNERAPGSVEVSEARLHPFTLIWETIFGDDLAIAAQSDSDVAPTNRRERETTELAT